VEIEFQLAQIRTCLRNCLLSLLGEEEEKRGEDTFFPDEHPLPIKIC